MVEEMPPAVGEDHPLRRADEQRCPQQGLQFLDGTGDRGLRNVQKDRRLRNLSHFRCGHEITDLPEGDGHV